MKAYSTRLIAQAKRHLRGGGVIAYPTESCFGLGCDPLNLRGIQKILRLKGRSQSKGLIVIAGATRQLKQIIQPLSASEQLALTHYWPGFTSLLLPVNRKISQLLVGQHNKIAVRVSQHPLVAQLCRELHSPLVSTSANRSGCQSIKNHRECARQFGSQVMILPGLTQFKRKPSTIIDWPSGAVLRK